MSSNRSNGPHLLDPAARRGAGRRRRPDDRRGHRRRRVSDARQRGGSPRGPARRHPAGTGAGHDDPAARHPGRCPRARARRRRAALDPRRARHPRRGRGRRLGRRARRPAVAGGGVEARAGTAVPRPGLAAGARGTGARPGRRARSSSGGRSAGARVACRTAAAVGASAVVALSFPLHPPGRPERSRAAELATPAAARHPRARGAGPHRPVRHPRRGRGRAARRGDARRRHRRPLDRRLGRRRWPRWCVAAPAGRLTAGRRPRGNAAVGERR